MPREGRQERKFQQTGKMYEKVPDRKMWPRRQLWEELRSPKSESPCSVGWQFHTHPRREPFLPAKSSVETTDLKHKRRAPLMGAAAVFAKEGKYLSMGLLKLQHAYKSPGDLVKRQTLMQESGGGASESSLLTAPRWCQPCPGSTITYSNKILTTYWAVNWDPRGNRGCQMTSPHLKAGQSGMCFRGCVSL